MTYEISLDSRQIQTLLECCLFYFYLTCIHSSFSFPNCISLLGDIHPPFSWFLLYMCEILTPVCPLQIWGSVNALLYRSIYPSIGKNISLLAAILSSVTIYFYLFFPFKLTSKLGTHVQMSNPSLFSTHACTHTHIHTQWVSHPFSSPSDVLLSCSLDIGSIQLQSRLAANHRTLRRASVSPACSAFAGAHFSGQPSQAWGGATGYAGWTRRLKAAREIQR